MGVRSAVYEDDTLVIDIVGIEIGPFSMVDVYGTGGWTTDPNYEGKGL
jgi:hypothetical protein